MDNSKQFLWLEQEVVPKIVEAVGEDVRNFRSEVKVLPSFVIASSIFLVEFDFFSSDKKGGEKRPRFVVKVPPESESTRAFFRTELLFHNEILFYRRLGKNCPDYPTCVLTIEEPIERAVIVLEDVTRLGYKGLRQGERLTMEHVLAAVREIGKFHGRGYVLKENNPKEFFEVAKGFRETSYDASAHPAMIDMINKVSQRPVDYLRSAANFEPEFCEKILLSLSSAHEKILRDCIEPRNELAVLCHGDWTSNNILFREEDDGRIKGMLIDFAQLRFSSPAVDLSTFLYLSCGAEVRKNFPLIFKAYHKAVLEHLEAEGVRDREKYSFENFLNDYKRHAIFGCEVAIYYKPVIRSHEAIGSRDKFDFLDIGDNPSKYIDILIASGGDELSKELADTLLELKDNGCLDHLLL